MTLHNPAIVSLDAASGMALIKYAEEDRTAILQEELKMYEATIGRLSRREKKELRAWVAAGNSVSGNPYSMDGANGRLLDYITAARIMDDMWDHPEKYQMSFWDDSRAGDENEVMC